MTESMDRYHSTFHTYNQIALLYQEKFMHLDLYNDTYDLFCKLIKKPGPAIFEIGCGPGNITRYLLSKRPDFKIEAIDMAPKMIELAKINNPSANFSIMDCRDIDKLDLKFDAIMCGFCMPYLSKEDCAKLIRDCSQLLNDDGILYFSTIEGDYNKSDYVTSSNGEHKVYVYYHEEGYLLDGLRVNNLKLTNLERKHYPNKDGSSDTHMIFIATKK